MRLRHGIVAILLFTVSGKVWADGALGCQLLQPTGLRTEYQQYPICIETQTPRLDWQLVASQPNLRNVVQTAYQIQVSSTPREMLMQDSGDLWDSGKVKSNQTTQIPYAGFKLYSREECYWRVRSWDGNDVPTPWSDPVPWEMGMLEPSDWKAQMIQAPDGVTSDTPGLGSTPVPMFRKEFDLGDLKVFRARLYVTAYGVYEIWVNGKRMGPALAPDWTDYSKRLRYQTYNLTDLLKKGKNVIVCLLGNGWYCGHIGNGGFQSWGKKPGLFAQLEVTGNDFSRQAIVTDASWKVCASPTLSSDLMMGEVYDARQELEHWNELGLDDSTWPNAVVMEIPTVKLCGQVDGMVDLSELRQPVSLKQVQPGVWIYDFGQNIVGVPELKVKGDAGTKVMLRFGEMLNPDGTLYTANLRNAKATDVYICKGADKLETWMPRFAYHGFRYAELTGFPGQPTTDTLQAVVLGTDFTRTGTIDCWAPLVKQLQDNIVWGMRGNFFSVPTDCPQRDERMGWMGDAGIFVRTAAYNGDVAAFFTKWLVDVDDAQLPDGEFVDVAPSPRGRGHGNGGVPGWGDAGVICPWTMYQFYGDKRILQEHLPAMARWVDWCSVHSTNGIRDKDRGPDYGDWLAQGEDTPKDLIGTAFFAHSADLVGRAYRVVGDDARAKIYEDLFDQIRESFSAKFINYDGRVTGETQTGYALALEFGLMPENLKYQAGKLLAENVAKHGDHLTTGFLGVSHLLPALTDTAQYGELYKVFLQQSFPSWMFSIKQGATTIWERWDGWTPEKGFQNPGMNSFNHYSLGSCGEWMFESMGGIQLDPDQPGFSHVIIRPVPSPRIGHVKATYNSIHGLIASSWTVEKANFTLVVNIPANVTATVFLPTAQVDSIQESGAPLQGKKEIKVGETEPRGTPCEVGSGSYLFTCRVR